MKGLGDHLRQQIKRLGPITVADYMNQCLYHPSLGYYTNATPIGAKGDFITAPEISQMFGELIGLCLAQSWLDQGAPTPFCLAELGPGSGQLMADILRATKGVAGFHDAALLHLCEVNPALKAEQTKKLAAFDPRWVSDSTEFPEMPLFLVANEFFDCLPVRQFFRTDSGWQEKMIAVDGRDLCFARAPVGELANELPRDAPQGSVLELCASANAIVSDLAGHVSAHGGCVLVLDYGSSGELGDTLQAVQGHKKVAPLAHPGGSDLTAHVDFSALSNAAAAKAQVSAVVPQGVFLEQLGITARAHSLARCLSDQALENHIAAHRRLTHPDEMGKLFKALAITPKGPPQPPGFSQ